MKYFNKSIKTFIVFFLFFFSLNSIGLSAFELDIGSAINNLQTKIKRNSEVSFGGKAVIDDVYKSALKYKQKENMESVFLALDITSKYFSTKYSCNINSKDIVDILYFASSNFKNKVTINLDNFKKPTKSSMGSACYKISSCISKEHKGNNPSSIQDCQVRVENIYLQYYNNFLYLNSIGMALDGTDSFWNNNLDDSSYDIMHDIYTLGTILFQDMPKPAQIAFFKMPTVNYNEIYNEPKINMNIDWFSPYNNFYIDEPEETETTTDADLDLELDSLDQHTTDVPVVQGNLDSDIESFVTSSTFNLSNPGFSLAGNKCVSGFVLDDFMISKTLTGTTITLTPQAYLTTVLDDIETMTCNLDGICQSWETSSCADCTSLYNDTEGNLGFDEIQSIVENMADTDNEDYSTPVLSCLQQCQKLPCNALNCDKLVCYAQCLCLEYEPESLNTGADLGVSLSGVFGTGIEDYMGDDKLGLGVLSSSFKLKFCIVPAVATQSSKKKTAHVYNIASVFSEIHNVLKDLRNSGELGVNIKAKEFLESTKQENKFADQLSFTIDNTTKSLHSNEDESVSKEKQIELNTSLMTNLLGFSKEMNLESEIDKYVLMDEPCSYIIDKEAVSDIDDRETKINSCKEEREQALQSMNRDFQSVFLNQQAGLITTELDNFMLKNRDFWYESLLMFNNLLDTSITLSKKPKE